MPYTQEPVFSPYPEPEQPNPRDILYSVLILLSHLRLGAPNCLFPSGFPIRILYATLLSPIRATCPAHLIILDLITRRIFSDWYRSLSSYLCSLVVFPITSLLLGPNIFLTTLLSNTFSLRFSLKPRDQASYHTKHHSNLHFCIS